MLQLNRSELVHMRHVMVKIELDSRLQGGQREVDTMMTRLEGGRVCVVCTRSVEAETLHICFFLHGLFLQDQIQLLFPRRALLRVSVLHL